MKKHTRELRQLLQRSRVTSLQKFGNYSREVLQADEWLIFAPAVHLAKWMRGVHCRLLIEIVCSGSQNVVASAILSGEVAFAREL